MQQVKRFPVLLSYIKPVIVLYADGM
jgi:hypothetical protein